MTKSSIRTLLTAAAVVASSTLAFAQELPKVVTSGFNPGDVRKIQLGNQAWNKNVAIHNLDGLVDAYADKGRRFAPNQPPIVGKEALRAHWGSLLNLPEFFFDTTDTHLIVAKSGDIAWVTGDYVLSYKEGQGKVEDKGKYVLLYEKVAGEWKIVLDIDNSNGR